LAADTINMLCAEGYPDIPLPEHLARGQRLTEQLIKLAAGSS
jgi:hypothetical protein